MTCIPSRLTYDELLEKTHRLWHRGPEGRPEGKIAGPAEWGWLGYQYSAKDIVAGVFLRPDRRAHGDEALLPWYLRKLREHEQKTGVKVLDIVDVHFYPMADGIGITTGGKTDPATSALRIRATRSLWDPTYKDESWIDARMQAHPDDSRMDCRRTIRVSASRSASGTSAPRTHMSGGLAVAEVLGRFGQERRDLGLLLDRARRIARRHSGGSARIRNFDGNGGHFLDRTVPVTGSATLTSLFASRDEEREQGRRGPAQPLGADPTEPGNHAARLRRRLGGARPSPTAAARTVLSPSKFRPTASLSS